MTAPPVQGPLWHPLPQWAVVLPQNYDISAALRLPVPIIGMLTPYREQQPPWGQFPQTVLALLAPQDPSVVVTSVDGATVGFPRTGSWEEEVLVGWVVGVAPPSQPIWHPSATEQLPNLQPYIWQVVYVILTAHSFYHNTYQSHRLATALEAHLSSREPTHKMNSNHRMLLPHHM